MAGVLVFDDEPVPTTTQGESGRALVILDDSSDVLTFDPEAGRQVQELEGTTDFLVFDVGTTVVEVSTGADFLLMDPPKQQTVVQIEGSEQDVLVLTPGGPPGPPGPPGSPGLAGSAPVEYVQVTPAASWTVVHNLGYRPDVWLFIDSSPDELVHTDVSYPDDNTVYIEWPSPESGSAYVR